MRIIKGSAKIDHVSDGMRIRIRTHRAEHIAIIEEKAHYNENIGGNIIHHYHGVDTLTNTEVLIQHNPTLKTGLIATIGYQSE